jgi:hypothetical protein
MRKAVSPARLRLALFLTLATMAIPFDLSAEPLTGPQAAVDSTRSAVRSPAIGLTQAPTAQSDSLAKAPKSRSDSVIVVKHHFNHREQIITGSVIMTCLALMMVAMNNYNPR